MDFSHLMAKFSSRNPESGKLVYINGGHEAVFVIDQNGVRDRLMPTGPAVGPIAQAKFAYKKSPTAAR
jgi:serine phosphatase RsbU (regulator of sigma subunit)